jgi:hypothetical protein
VSVVQFEPCSFGAAFGVEAAGCSRCHQGLLQELIEAVGGSLAVVG